MMVFISVKIVSYGTPLILRFSCLHLRDILKIFIEIYFLFSLFRLYFNLNTVIKITGTLKIIDSLFSIFICLIDFPIYLKAFFFNGRRIGTRLFKTVNTSVTQC